MYYTHNISYPRSGHRCLLQLLKTYFGEQIKACSIYSPNKISNPNYLKDHDFGLSVKPVHGTRYVIQIRYPLESLISYYKLSVKDGQIPDKKIFWENFAHEKMSYWINFYNKWVLSDISQPKLVVNYADMMDETQAILEKTIDFVTGHKSDPKKVLQTLSEYEVKRRNSMRDFKYYDEAFFDTLRTRIKDLPGIDVKKDQLIVS